MYVFMCVHVNSVAYTNNKISSAGYKSLQLANMAINFKMFLHCVRLTCRNMCTCCAQIQTRMSIYHLYLYTYRYIAYSHTFLYDNELGQRWTAFMVSHAGMSCNRNVCVYVSVSLCSPFYSCCALKPCCCFF